MQYYFLVHEEINEVNLKFEVLRNLQVGREEDIPVW
jgi:hypothetical protein